MRLMVVKDPRQSVETILEFLMGVNGARATAVFALEPQPSLFVGRGIAQVGLDWTLARWTEERGALQSGRWSRADERFLIPVARQERVNALLYLEAAQVDLESLSEVTPLIASAVHGGLTQPAMLSPVESYLEQTPSEEIERRKLLILLDRHEWNVARVARELRMTRTTVYKRLADFAIPRKRVPKSGRQTALHTT
jgi:hypothetical protein